MDWINPKGFGIPYFILLTNEPTFNPEAIVFNLSSLKIYTIIILILPMLLSGQNIVIENTNVERLKELAQKWNFRYEMQKAEAIQKANEEGWPIQEDFPNYGGLMTLQRLSRTGKPIYYITDNLNAAKTVSTDKVWVGGSSGLDLTGNGINIGEWDAGRVRDTHREVTGRISHGDGASSTHYHSTHVGGTILATGVDNAARGMASQATITDYDYSNDVSEMFTAASGGLILSNHSYGILCGWYLYLGFIWRWAGDEGVDSNEDYKFGYYTQDESQAWDDIAYNAPYYLILKSAGNDRGAGPTGDPREQDGGTNGYDCVGPQTAAKNVLAVGAVEDIPAGYSQPSDVVMSSFSSWGPTDDGRIKPDIVANGIEVYSCDDTADDAYLTIGGTSMATPNATGSLALLQQHYKNKSGGTPMRAATLKALVIHTADEAGPADGPDYKFGWGLLNTHKAAALIDSVWTDQKEHTIKEVNLAQGNNYSFQVISDGSTYLRVTICWTDPPGTPVSPLELDPPDIMLVNDLDLRLTRSATTYYPWKFDNPDPNNPSTSATTGDNIRDNVEQVYISSPPSGTYTITVNHKGTLNGDSQAFSLIMSGAHYSDQSLPVELASFSATAGNGLAYLNWKTESELDNLGFNILRSNYKDYNYKQVASYANNDNLKGLGSSSHGKEYSYYDFDLVNSTTYWYMIEDVSIDGNRTSHGPLAVTPDASSLLTRESLNPPGEFALSQNYPNPFNPSTSFVIEIPGAKGGVLNSEVIIYDILGQKIKTLFKGNLSTGRHIIHWNGADDSGRKANSGVFIYSVKAGSYHESKKMVLVR